MAELAAARGVAPSDLGSYQHAVRLVLTNDLITASRPRGGALATVLAAHPIRVSRPRVFVCENPAVLRRARAELGAACPPLVCTEGRPSAAFHRLVGLTAGAGAELWYHGDFDWPGVAIAAEHYLPVKGRLSQGGSRSPPTRAALPLTLPSRVIAASA